MNKNNAIKNDKLNKDSQGYGSKGLTQEEKIFIFNTLKIKKGNFKNKNTLH